MTHILTNDIHKKADESSAPVAAESRNFFNTEHLKTDLKRHSIQGGAVTMTAQITKFVLRTGATVVLARLLTPQDYGLIAMVTAITGFVELFKDMGLSFATIQKPEINHAQVSTLFWINVAVSIMLALILAAMAPVISWFYSEPRLTYIALVLAGTFIFSGLAVQHEALLRRQMRFLVLAAIDVGSLLIGITTGIVMAWYGIEYWALVGYSVAMAISNVVLLWIFFKWRPSLPVRGAGVRSMVVFGGHLTGYGIVNYFARNLDQILLGRFSGANVLGLYSRAYSIMMLPIVQVRGPLNAVAAPALSHIQDDPVRYKKYYIKLVTLIAFITMPLMVFMFICANEIVGLLLGNKWSGAADIFKILCICALIQPVSTTTGLVLVSLGQSKRYFTFGVINSIIIVISFVLGLPWGAIGVAKAYTIATYMLLIPTLWYSFRQSPVSIRDFFSAIFKPFVVSLCMGTGIFTSYLFLRNHSDVMVVGTCFILGLLSYLLVWILIPGGVQTLRGLVAYKPSSQ